MSNFGTVLGHILAPFLVVFLCVLSLVLEAGLLCVLGLAVNGVRTCWERNDR